MLPNPRADVRWADRIVEIDDRHALLKSRVNLGIFLKFLVKMCQRVREEICRNLDENLGNLAESTEIYRNLRKFVEIWENLAESAGIC